VLQGKSEQGMSSLSLVPENEELSTDSWDPIYTQNLCHSHEKHLVTKPPTSDKHDFDSSLLDFDIGKMIRVFVLSRLL
jgi:hypothetical protein